MYFKTRKKKDVKTKTKCIVFELYIAGMLSYLAMIEEVNKQIKQGLTNIHFFPSGDIRQDSHRIIFGIIVSFQTGHVQSLIQRNN